MAPVWAQGQVDRRVSGLLGWKILSTPECSTLIHTHYTLEYHTCTTLCFLAATFSHDAHLMKTRIWHPINIIIHPHMWLFS